MKPASGNDKFAYSDFDDVGLKNPRLEIEVRLSGLRNPRDSLSTRAGRILISIRGLQSDVITATTSSSGFIFKSSSTE